MALCLLTSWTWAQEFQKTSSGIKTAISGKQTDIEIQWFGPNTLRVLKTPQGKSVKKESLSVIAHPQNSGIKITTPGNGCIVMTSQTLTVTLNPQTGIITYAKPNGDTLLIEQENVKAFTPINDAGRSTYSVYQGFTTSIWFRAMWKTFLLSSSPPKATECFGITTQVLHIPTTNRKPPSVPKSAIA